jgi:hypothetical protein
MAAITVETLQVLYIACVGELVEVNDWLIRLSDPVQNEVAADKPGTASDKQAHKTTSSEKETWLWQVTSTPIATFLSLFFNIPHLQ